MLTQQCDCLYAILVGLLRPLLRTCLLQVLSPPFVCLVKSTHSLIHSASVKPPKKVRRYIIIRHHPTTCHWALVNLVNLVNLVQETQWHQRCSMHTLHSANMRPLRRGSDVLSSHAYTCSIWLFHPRRLPTNRNRQGSVSYARAQKAVLASSRVCRDLSEACASWTWAAAVVCWYVGTRAASARCQCVRASVFGECAAELLLFLAMRRQCLCLLALVGC